MKTGHIAGGNFGGMPFFLPADLTSVVLLLAKIWGAVEENHKRIICQNRQILCYTTFWLDKRKK